MVVRDSAGDVAVARTTKGYHLPGGGLEAGETPHHAAVRETQEETGLIISAGREFARALEFVFSAEEGACYAKDSVFLTGAIAGSGAASEADHDLLWLRPDDAARLLTRESHRWALRQLLPER